MARTAYWIVVAAADYTGTPPSGLQVRNGQQSNGSATGVTAGSEAFAAESDTGTITEATAVTLSAGTAYKIAWTIYDDVADDYATVAVGEYVTTVDLVASAIAVSGAVSATGDIQIGTSFDISATAVAVSGALTTSGDIEITPPGDLDLAADPLALSGVLSVSGDIEIGTSFDLAADPLSVTGALSASGDIEIGTSFDVSASAISVSGTVAVSGDIESSVDPILEVVADPLSITGTISASGDIQIGTSFDLATDPIAITGTLSASGDIEIGTSFDLSASPVALTGSLSTSGDIQSSTDPVVVVAPRKRGGGVNRFVEARKRLPMPFLVDWLTNDEPTEATQRVIREIKAGRPIPQDAKPPKGPENISPARLASAILPNRAYAFDTWLSDLIVTSRAVEKAVQIARDKDDEDILLLL
jgi:hypothetical protein